MKIDKSNIHNLFAKGKYIECYMQYASIFNKMLCIDSEAEFLDFLSSEEDPLSEELFWLYYDVEVGEKLLIGAYEGNISKKVQDYVKVRMPDDVYIKIADYLDDVYVDMDCDNVLAEKINSCNEILSKTGYRIICKFDDTNSYVYFLAIDKKVV